MYVMLAKCMIREGIFVRLYHVIHNKNNNNKCKNNIHNQVIMSDLMDIFIYTIYYKIIVHLKEKYMRKCALNLCGNVD